MSTLNKIFYIIFLFTFGIGYAQIDVPYYEQIAFDFYSSHILDSIPVSEKISIYKEIEPHKTTENPFWHSRCLKKTELTENTYFEFNISEKTILNISNLDSNKFKTKKYGKGRYPKLYVSQSVQVDNKRIFVIVTEVYKWHGTIYYIELDNNGKIIDWCKSGYLE